MQGVIKENLLQVLKDAIVVLEKEDHFALQELSNHTIHDASIFQEDDPLTCAVVLYALSKVLQRCADRDISIPIVLPLLKKAIAALEKDDEDKYRSVMKQVLQKIAQHDAQMKLYIQEVIEKAKIKNASKLHEHGISIARTAELLGLSQWELQTYIGKTISDTRAGVQVNERLKKARQQMKTIVFDSGPIISLTTNNLIWLLGELKGKTTFYLTPSVKRELVDKPLQTLRFKFEALQVEKLIEEKIITVMSNKEFVEITEKLLSIANQIISAQGENIQIVQRAEMETLAAAIRYRVDAIVIDERITRTLLENPQELKKLMEKRLHMQVNLNRNALSEFSALTKNIRVLRSVELVTIAYERGILDKFIVKIPFARRELLESVLWGLKLNGCSVSEDEINTIVRLEKL